ncbi:MAG: hypothetical protein HY860_01895 [Chlamydiales bacterium]|nr:hypothetical protein [Chlamydiales bacterium]
MLKYTYNHTAMPPSLRKILTWMVLLSSVGALTHRLYLPWIETNIQSLLALSSWGISHGMIWQFFTYLFVQPIGSNITFSFFTQLFFNLFLTFYIGKSIIEWKGYKHFYFLFLTGGVFSAIATTLLLLSFHSPFYLAGCHHVIYSLLTGWMFLFPARELLFFLVFPIKIKWLLVIAAASTLFIDLANGNFVNFFSILFSILFGYFYSLIVFELHSAFPLLHAFEKKIFSLKKRLFGSKKESIETFMNPRKRKIYDFKTGKVILDDETFMDVCLEKIAKLGKSSLSLYERFRLKRITRKRKKSNGFL